MKPLSAVIVGHWKTKTVWINGEEITLSRFIRDLKADEKEPGENRDIIKECQSVDSFSWGDSSQATDCLSLACCFYLDIDWVMCRFFGKELEKAQQKDMELVYDEDTLLSVYKQSEELFAREFKTFMKEIGAKEIVEDDTRN